MNTLDGHDTFHGMGIIACCYNSICKLCNSVPRINVTADQLINAGKIDIKFYKPPLELSSLRFNDLKKTKFVDKTRNLETLLKITWPLRSSIMGWSGFMQSVQGGKFPGQSSICFLPMIDMNPNDMTCIYSTLSFICSTARRHLITSTVTFDQPLYWKVLTIISNEPIDSPLRSLALRLGGCHLEMSFFGMHRSYNAVIWIV